jgi:hypothetical protein
VNGDDFVDQPQLVPSTSNANIRNSISRKSIEKNDEQFDVNIQQKRQ